MKTSYGLEFDILPKEEVGSFEGYDKVVAQCHIANCGCIIVETRYHQPVDNEYDLEEIYGMLEQVER
jgi:hypothetical protein